MNATSDPAGTPAAPPAQAPARRVWPWLAIAGTVLLGVSITLGLWWGKRQDWRRESLAYVDYRARDAQERLVQRLGTYQQVLAGARGLFDAAAQVDRLAWHVYTESLDLQVRFPGIQGLGHAVALKPQELRPHEGSVRARGFPEYRVTPPGFRPQYSAVVFVEPFRDRNLRAFGYDMLTEPVRRAALEQARDENRTILSGPVTLVQETDAGIQSGFLMVMPVYRPGQAVATVAQRRAALRGWIFASFRMDDFLAGVLGEQGGDLDLQVFDGEGADPARRMDQPGRRGAAAVMPWLDQQNRLSFGGRTWTLRVRAQAPIAEHMPPSRAPQTLALGLLSTAVMALVVGALALGRHRAEHLAAATESLHRATFDHAGAGIAHVSLDGRILRVNRTLGAMLGYAPEDLAGKHIRDLVHPQDGHLDLEAKTRLLSDGMASFTQEKRYLRRDGSTLWASLTGSCARSPEGGRVFYIGVVQDISRRKEAESSLASSEARFRAMFERNQLPTLELDAETGRILEANPAAAAFFGRGQDRLKRCSLMDLDASPDAEVRERLCQARESQGLRFESRVRLADGRIRDVEVHTSPVPAGHRTALFTHILDITDRKAAEAALDVERQRLQGILEGTHVGTWEWHVQTGEATFNARWAEILGCTLAELAPVSIQTWMDLAHPEDLAASEAALQAHFRGEQPYYEAEARMRHKDGRWVWVLDRGKVTQWSPDGRPLVMMGTHQDITQRKEAEAALQQSEAKFRQVFEKSPSAMSLTRVEDGRILRVNQAWSRLYGFEESEALGRTLLELGLYDSQAQRDRLVADMLEHSGLLELPLEARRRDGSSAFIHLGLTEITADGEAAFLAVIQDHTALHRAEQALKASQQQLASLFDILPVGVVVTDAAGQIVEANPASERILGLSRSETTARTFDAPAWRIVRPDGSVMPPEEYASVRALREGRTVEDVEMGIHRADGEVTWILTTATPIPVPGLGVSIVITDITSRKQAQDQLEALNRSLERRVEEELAARMAHERALVHQSRLAAMGEMIGNIAHQWRQPLNALGMILANLQDARRFGQLTDAYLESTVKQGKALVQKMSTTITDFTDFFRPGKEARPFSIREQAAETLELLAPSLLHQGIEVQLTGGGDARALGHANEFSQVLLNLLANARDAIQSAGVVPGRIQLRAGVEARGAFLEVRDNGGGIRVDPLARIFEPYFTDKAGGTGLGLYMSRMILERSMGGTLEARNTLEGACFTIHLPLAEACHDDQP